MYYIDASKIKAAIDKINNLPDSFLGGKVVYNGNSTDVDISEFKFWEQTSTGSRLTTLTANTLTIPANGTYYVGVKLTPTASFAYTANTPELDFMPLAAVTTNATYVTSVIDLRSSYSNPNHTVSVSGDLSGNMPSPLVEYIQGKHVSTVIPTQDEKAALVGASDSVSGAPNASNAYLLNDDKRVNHPTGIYSDYGKLVLDHGLAIPAGSSVDVSSIFSSETASDGVIPGVVTLTPNNYVHLLDQKRDQINHSTGSKVFGRLTETSGVWTLTFYYVDSAGTEVAVANMQTDLDPGSSVTDIQLVGTPKVFASNDTTRPVFQSNILITDNIVGETPIATTTTFGKVKLATNTSTDSSVVQSQDTRLPAQNEKDALVGTYGTPGLLNKYVTETDPLVVPTYYSAFARSEANLFLFLITNYSGTFTSGETITSGTGSGIIAAPHRETSSIGFLLMQAGTTGFNIGDVITGAVSGATATLSEILVADGGIFRYNSLIFSGGVRSSALSPITAYIDGVHKVNIPGIYKLHLTATSNLVGSLEVGLYIPREFLSPTGAKVSTSVVNNWPNIYTETHTLNYIADFTELDPSYSISFIPYYLTNTPLTVINLNVGTRLLIERIE